jgi:hypothetical protein
MKFLISTYIRGEESPLKPLSLIFGWFCPSGKTNRNKERNTPLTVSKLGMPKASQTKKKRGYGGFLPQ